MPMNIYKAVMNIPTPANISMMWNFGSMLGISMVLQVVSGFFLSMHYNPSTLMAFNSYINMGQMYNNGFILQMVHAHTSSLIFVIMYIHILKSLLNKSYKYKILWMSGNLILVMTMMSAFLGYVLPWGQMSFWGATVITNILSSIPYIGKDLTNWVWGGFSVGEPTLNRFYSLHFLLPMLILLMATLHLNILHNKGSSNQLGISSNKDKVLFGKSFMYKDMVSITMMMMLYYFSFMFMVDHHYSMSKENFFPADPLNTPTHIKPEWYFMFAYSMLRCVPNKVGGILTLMVLFVMFLSTMFKNSTYSKFNVNSKIKISMVLLSFIILTTMGYMLIEYPYIELSQFMSVMLIFTLMIL